MPGPTVANVVLRALLYAVTPATAALLNQLLLELLEELAAKTETDLDDKLFRLFKRFLATSNPSRTPDPPHAD